MRIMCSETYTHLYNFNVHHIIVDEQIINLPVCAYKKVNRTLEKCLSIQHHQM